MRGEKWDFTTERAGKANRPGSRIKAWPVKWLILLFLLACFLWSLVSPRPPRLAAQTTIKRSSSAIAVTSDGAFCLVVNPDSNSLSLIDTSTQEKIAEIVVSPSGDRLYMWPSRVRTTSPSWTRPLLRL